MPARYRLDGVVVDSRSGEPVADVGVVARAPNGEILASSRSDPHGAFRLRVAHAALRGLRWEEPVLAVTLERDASFDLAGDPAPWRLEEGPSEAVTLAVAPPGAAPRTVLTLVRDAGSRLEPSRPDVLVAAAVVGLAESMRRGAVDPVRARAWLFGPGALARATDAGLPDAILDLLRQGAVVSGSGANAASLDGLERDALAALRSLAEDPDDGGTAL